MDIPIDGFNRLAVFAKKPQYAVIKYFYRIPEDII